MTLFLIILATIAVHRIWHYEDIFATPRVWLPVSPLVTPIPIALGISAVALIEHPVGHLVLTALAVYPFLRGAVWLYQKYEPAAPAEKSKCSSCETKRQAMQTLQKDLRKWEKRILLIGGTPLNVARSLVPKHPKWLFIVTGKQGDIPDNLKLPANVMFQPVIDDNAAMTMNRLMGLILNGGNATIVTLEAQPAMVEKIGMLKAVAWVHVGVRSALPAHHRVVAQGEDLATVIETTLAPA